ncbi:hypothetical protein GCM10010254_23650 [Streptomyces chromofuscus]|nr:hypothetical protein GCM10010254_23650 [Streptomyces chromofuscus]
MSNSPWSGGRSAGCGTGRRPTAVQTASLSSSRWRSPDYDDAGLHLDSASEWACARTPAGAPSPMKAPAPPASKELAAPPYETLLTVSNGLPAKVRAPACPS